MASTIESAQVYEVQEQGEQDSLLALRHKQITDQYRAYFHETLNVIGVAGEDETAQLEQWVEQTKATEDDVHALQEFWDLQIRNQLRSGRALREQFDEAMKDAVKKGITSEKWAKRWTEKFEDKRANYKQREYWVSEQLPEQIRRWEDVVDEKKKTVRKDEFARIVNLDPRYAVLQADREKEFLDLPLVEQKNIIDDANSAMIAETRMMRDLHQKARSMLIEQVEQGVLSKQKVGGWLKRIFTPKCTTKSVTKILTEKGKGTLDDCIQNWTVIRMRFDACTEKFEKLPEAKKPRGLRMMSPEKFLGLHYDERTVYVRNLEARLSDAEEVQNEREEIIHIRHVMDIGEWSEALELIKKLEQDTSLNKKDRDRLEKMKQYSTRLYERTKPKEKKVESAEEAIDTIDELMARLEIECPEEVEKVESLLESHHPNRGIANFYWITYNHIWCRDHLYLTDDIAKKGAKKETIAQTRERAEKSEDVGMHDAISDLTADDHFFRKTEFAEKGATYQHIDASSAKAQNAHINWLLKEHTFYEMYWTNYCASNDSIPKTALWHENLASILKKLRSATRTLEESGGTYQKKWKRRNGQNSEK